MTELGSKIIKNETNQHDNPDFAWILRDFELDVNHANRYLEEKLNKNDQNILKYFKQRKFAFLPPWNKLVESLNTEFYVFRIFNSQCNTSKG